MKYIILLFLIACQSEQKSKEEPKGVKTLYALDSLDSTIVVSAPKCDTVYIHDTIVVYRTKNYGNVDQVIIGE
jgi:hypothetical protein